MRRSGLFVFQVTPGAKPERVTRVAIVKSEPPASDQPRGYLDQTGAAHYTGFSRDQFQRLVTLGIFKPGRPLTPNGKRLHKISDLDAAIEKAWRSRKPKRQPRGIVRQREEAKRELVEAHKRRQESTDAQ
jgi:hypothetical protein